MEIESHLIFQGYLLHALQRLDCLSARTNEDCGNYLINWHKCNRRLTDYKKKNKVTGVYTKIVCKETLKNAATSSK